MQNILKFTFTSFALVFFFAALAQKNINTGYIIDINTFQNSVKLNSSEYEIAFTDKELPDINTIFQLNYQHPSGKIASNGTISGNINAGHIYLKFILTNPSDTVQSVYFYAGYYFKSNHLFKIKLTDTSGKLQPLPDAIPGKNGIGEYRIIALSPHEKSTYYVQLQPLKIKTNKLYVDLIRPAYLSTHFSLLRINNATLEIITYILVGIMSMMVLFALANFILSRKDEFLYYCLYAILISFLLFAKTYLYRSATDFTYFFEEYLDFIIMLTGLICYVAFIRYFLGTAINYPWLDRVLRIMEAVYIVFIVIYSFTYFASNEVLFIDMLETIMKLFMLAGGLLFIILGWRLKNKLANYLITGNIAMVLFGLISLFLIVYPVHTNSVLSSALFYYDIGIVSELAFFLFGLTYKGRQELIEKVKIEDAMNLEQEKKEFEKQLAIIQAQQEERNRISADMHDELGGGMTAIRLMSELAKQRMQDADIPEIEKISASANDLLSKMNAIIWSMSPSNDSLANLVAYIRSYAQEFFENTAIHCSITVQEDIPRVEMGGIKRRNIFLAVKEALNNVVKHSFAGEVSIVIEFKNALVISIHDNGRGIDIEKIKQFGNGLTNMRRRMYSINATFQIERNNGTLVTFTVDLK